MATITNGNKRAELSLSVEVLGSEDPNGGMVTHGPVGFFSPVAHVEVTYRANNVVYLQTRLLTPRHSLLMWPKAIEVEMYDLEELVLTFGVESPEFQMWAQKVHVENEDDPPEEAFYTLDAFIDTCVLPGSEMVTFDGLQIHFGGLRGHELIAFARTLAEEVESVPLVTLGEGADSHKRSLTILLPSYTQVRHFLRILQGVPDSLYRSTFDAIWGQRGSRLESVDWKDPDTWIAERLDGEERALAQRIWDESGHEFNPRYLRPVRNFVNLHHLQEQDRSGLLRMTERGQRFLEELEGQIVAEIDLHEGVLSLLRILTELRSGKYGDVLPGFTHFCVTDTTCQSHSSIREALSRRFRNLLERRYVRKQLKNYTVTEQGLKYLVGNGRLFAKLHAGGEPVSSKLA